MKNILPRVEETCRDLLTPYTFNLGLQAIELYRFSIHFQFTLPHALGFSVFTSRILATDL
jgi:hypothetical protein